MRLIVINRLIGQMSSALKATPLATEEIELKESKNPKSALPSRSLVLCLCSAWHLISYALETFVRHTLYPAVIDEQDMEAKLRTSCKHGYHWNQIMFLDCQSKILYLYCLAASKFWISAFVCVCVFTPCVRPPSGTQDTAQPDTSSGVKRLPLISVWFDG